MRSFLNEFGATSTVVNEITISSTTPEINLVDTTTGDDDWKIDLQSDDIVFSREGSEEFRFNKSADRLEIAGGLLTSGDVTVIRDATASVVSLTVSNTAAGSGSAASVEILANDDGSGNSDSRIRLGLNGTANSWWMYNDNSDSKHFKIGYGSGTGLADSSLIIDADTNKNVSIPGGDLTVSGGDANVTRAATGSNVTLTVENSATTGTTNRAQIEVRARQTGDARIKFIVNNATSQDYFTMGFDQSAGKFAIVNNNGITTPGSFTISTSGDVEIPSGDLTVSRSTASSTVDSVVYNGANSADSHARHYIAVGGTSAGDPYTRYQVPSGVDFAVGIDNDQGDAFCINRAASLATATACLVIDSLGIVKLPNSARVKKVSANAAVSSAQLTSSFGFAQATAGSGFIGMYSDSATAHHLVMCDGTDWQSVALTKAT